MRLNGIAEIVTGTKSIVKGAIHLAQMLPEDLHFWAAGRGWQIDGEVEGKAGESKTIELQPFCKFRGEKLIASDSGEGKITRICTILIGQRAQTSFGTGSPTMFFGPQVHGNSLLLDTCYRDQTIRFTVLFETDGKFECTLFGKAIL